jgi:hypothetical protein
MTGDSGGWTKLFSSHYPTWWDPSDWEEGGSAGDDDYSKLGARDLFAVNGTYTFRLELGDAGNWDSTPRSHYVVWTQGHDPFTDTTDGSDYVLIDGEQATSCGGFNGLHDRHYQDGAASGLRHAMTSDVDSGDNLGCWRKQIVPVLQYQSDPGYLDGFPAPSYHAWQVLWIR